MKSLAEIREDLKNTELFPRMALSFHTRDKRTGKTGEEKKLVLSFSVTLWRLLWIAAAVYCALQAVAAARAFLSWSRTNRRVKAALKEERERSGEG